jgi:hypothetical protein
MDDAVPCMVKTAEVQTQKVLWRKENVDGKKAWRFKQDSYQAAT